MSLALLVAGAAFAQQVGGTYTLDGQTYVVESVSGDKVTLKKQKGGRRPDDNNSGGQQDGGRRPDNRGREQWVTDLPTNANVAFQTARASGTDGFLSPSVDILKNGTPITLRNMNGREPQNKVRPFRLVHTGEGWYQIKNNEYGVVTLFSNTTSDGRQLELQGENSKSYSGAHQKFRIAKVGNGLYQIYTSNGKNFQVKNDKTADLTPVIQKTGTLSDSNQSAMWRIYTINRGNLTPLN